MSTLIGAKVTSYQPPITAIGSNFATTSSRIPFQEKPVFSNQLEEVEAGKDLTKIILILGGIVVAGALIYYTYQYIEEQKRYK